MVRRRGGGRRTEATRKGQWTEEEDEVLRRHVREHGPKEWSSIEARGMLPRNGKSCRLRWVNKLQPGLKTGCKFTAEEERVVIELQAKVGNKWAVIAKQLSGRTDNDVKNFWSTRKKKLARMSSKAPPPSCRRSGSSSPTESCSLVMAPFQEPTYHVGESSHQACMAMENNFTDAPSPGPLPASESLLGLPAPESLLPSSLELAMVPVPAAECSSYGIALVDQLSFGDTVYPAPLMVYPAVFDDMASADQFGDNVAYHLEPILEFEPIQFFGPGEDGMVFDQLSPETLDFFDQPPSPPPPPLLIQW